jgi:cytochrome c oxidase assembly factor CtaG
MTIRRDDLVAAAAAGLLQYRQIDPLLVFLLQRDITARREAMLAKASKRQFHGLYALLSFTVAVLAVVTAVMFSMLFASRAVYSLGSSAYVLFALLYMVAGLAIAAWFRRRGYCGRIRLLFAVVMASVPLAVVALQQVGA